MSDKIRPNFELDPRLPEDRDLRDAWEDIGDLDDLNMQDFMQILRLEHGISLNKESHILEVGVGKGRLLKRLQQEGYRVTGVEPRKRPEHTPDLQIAHIRIEEMPFSKETAQFDMVIASSVFDTVVYDQDQKLMVSRIVDSLRPGGIFVCGYVPGQDIPNNPRLKKLSFKAVGYGYMLAFQKV